VSAGCCASNSRLVSRQASKLTADAPPHLSYSVAITQVAFPLVFLLCSAMQTPTHSAPSEQRDGGRFRRLTRHDPERYRLQPTRYCSWTFVLEPSLQGELHREPPCYTAPSSTSTPNAELALRTQQSIGRRPVYLIGSTVFIPCAIWMALSNSYACFCIARVFAGLSSSWSQTVPPATVADMTIKSKRGDKMSLYGTAVVIAPAVAPLFCGLIIVSFAEFSLEFEPCRGSGE